MKRILNLTSILIVIIMCFTMCMIAGCNDVSDNLSSVDSNASHGEVAIDINDDVVDGENTDSTSGEVADGNDESNVDDSNAGDNTDNSAPANDSSSNVDSTVPAPAPESKPESEPVVSTPDETPSQDAPADEPTPDTSKPTDAIVDTPTYPTIQVGVVTTYYGYRGCFVLGNSDDYPVASILGVDDSLLTGVTTEYYDVETNVCLNFIFEGGIIEIKDIMYNHVYVVGEGSTPVQVVY